MAASIITTEDLQKFKVELLEDIKNVLSENQGTVGKRYLKSLEVRKSLSISPGTLQNMRVNGTLPFTKIGGVIYYDYQDIQKMLTENRIDNKY